MATLEESKAIQYDHYMRCKQLAQQGRANPQDLEVISYTDLATMLGNYSGKLLDVGCGGAEAYKYLTRFDYYGVEVLEEVAEIAKARVANPNNINVGFMETMPYPDSFFTVVWARHVLEHATDLPKVLAEIKRILTPEGVLAFCVPTDYNEEPAHFYRYNHLEWERAFTQAGLQLMAHGNHDFNLHEWYGIATFIK